MKSIWFDMDGTIAELYKVEGWLTSLREKDWAVYDRCIPRHNYQRINNAIEALIENGWQVGVITWASNGIDWGKELDAIAEIKFNWLCKFFPALANGKFACIPYGYSKADFLEEDEEASQVSIETSSIQFVNDNWALTLLANFETDEYKLIIRELD